MADHTTAARADQSAITTIERLEAIYRVASGDFDAIQIRRSRREDDLEKSWLKEAESQRFLAHPALERLLLVERPESMKDVSIVLDRLMSEIEMIASNADFEQPAQIDLDQALSMLVAIENLCVVVPALVGLEEDGRHRIARERFARRYDSRDPAEG